jgi:hypothetical protein
MIFHIVEYLAHNPVWLGLCGAGLTVAPIMGIMLIHRTK